MRTRPHHLLAIGMLLITPFLIPDLSYKNPVSFRLSDHDRVPSTPEYDIVFVSRQIPDRGSIYYRPAMSMPGVGIHVKYRIASPGFLCILRADGHLDTLINGAKPEAESDFLIDVNAPEVSYDGTTIVFAGIREGQYRDEPASNPGAWRIYSIKSDGSDLRQLSFSDRNIPLTQFGQAAQAMTAYDDTDPVWLPDGRICFSSTRFPVMGHYSGVRGSNLYVMNADGSELHRITTERNGADRPVVDPLTGKIVFARWWRNHRFPDDGMDSLHDALGRLTHKDGLSVYQSQRDRLGQLARNHWIIASINPDGTEVDAWNVYYRNFNINHYYGGAFDEAGNLWANFFLMINMTEASGFGGLRMYQRGAIHPEPVLGITSISSTNYYYFDTTGGFNHSFGIYPGDYAGEAEWLTGQQLVVSLARDIDQDYGLYLYDHATGNLEELFDVPGQSELQAKLIRPREIPPMILDKVTRYADDLPPGETGPWDKEGNFHFHNLNVYYNAPVDVPIVSAPGIGTAGSIRFYVDPQRTSPGSFPHLDWPILVDEVSVSRAGEISAQTPANVQSFEQLRTPLSWGYTVPATGGPYVDGAAHVAGENFALPGVEARCIGCHAGHTLIPIPELPEEILFTNLAPGSRVSVSSARDMNAVGRVIDRQVEMTPRPQQNWISRDNPEGPHWIDLDFPVDIWVRSVRLYDPRPFPGEMNISVLRGRVEIFEDETGSALSRTGMVEGPLTTNGKTVDFDPVKARKVRVWIDSVSGTVFGERAASIGEIEVIASGEAPMGTSLFRVPGRRVPAFEIYPNPGTEQVSIDWVSFHPIPDRIVILDLYGRALLNEKRHSPQMPININTSFLSAGTYLIQLWSKDEVFSRKWVKLN